MSSSASTFANRIMVDLSRFEFVLYKRSFSPVVLFACVDGVNFHLRFSSWNGSYFCCVRFNTCGLIRAARHESGSLLPRLQLAPLWPLKNWHTASVPHSAGLGLDFLQGDASVGGGVLSTVELVAGLHGHSNHTYLEASSCSRWACREPSTGWRSD